MNKQYVTLLVLLGLSVAFATVNHEILLEHLKSILGIGRTVLSWIPSFLSDRFERWLLITSYQSLSILIVACH